MTDGSATTLTWFAAVAHPDTEVREEIRSHLLADSEGSSADSIRAVVEERLRSERGTVIEPFAVTGDDVHQASDLAVVALSHPRGALQVVSRDKIAPEGGVRFEREPSGERIESRYVECLASRAASEGSPERAWRFSPGHCPDPQGLLTGQPIVGANVSADDLGFLIRIGPFARVWGVRTDDSTSASPTAAATPGQLGLVANITKLRRGSWLELRPRTAESMIRATAAMVANDWLMVSIAGNDPPLAAVAVRLALPEDDVATPLVGVRVLGQPVLATLGQWLSTDSRLDYVPDAVKRAIGDWLGVVPAWITTSFLKGHP